MRTIKAIHKPVYAPIDDLITYRAMPTRSVNHLDPFLFLNHHGPQVYPENNRGLPFGPHPHRGFETLTFVLKGDIMHQDTGGGKSVINEGGIQWMTAGRGLIHSEVSSDEFKKKGGEEEVIQLWLNLPSKYKMVDPVYTGLQKSEITSFYLDSERITVNLISGIWGAKLGSVTSLTGLTTSSIDFKKEGRISIQVPVENEVLFYVVRGELTVNGKNVQTHDLIEFANDDTAIEVLAEEDSLVIFCHGEPTGEPIVAQGPFVMNTEEEIYEAYNDYQNGKMGKWN